MDTGQGQETDPSELVVENKAKRLVDVVVPEKKRGISFSVYHVSERLFDELEILNFDALFCPQPPPRRVCTSCQLVERTVHLVMIRGLWLCDLF